MINDATIFLSTGSLFLLSVFAAFWADKQWPPYEPVDNAKAQRDYYIKRIDDCTTDEKLSDVEQDILGYYVRFEHHENIEQYKQEMELEILVKRNILFCSKEQVSK